MRAAEMHVLLLSKLFWIEFSSCVVSVSMPEVYKADIDFILKALSSSLAIKLGT